MNARLMYLLELVRQNGATVAELQELRQLVRSDESGDIILQVDAFHTATLQQMQDASLGDTERWQKVVRKILDADKLPVPANGTITSIPVRHVHLLRSNWWWAAAVILIMLAGSYFWLDSIFKKKIVQTITPAIKEAVAYTRNLSLPDGSTIVLHAGSILDRPASFNGNTREVSLEGEAYFDIAHDDTKPFIIHTGKLTTTVIGTAFNIKAAGERIIISVTRGKVKVENEQKLLAVLTHDEQLVYHTDKGDAQKQAVNANAVVTDWTRQDMLFDGVSFSAIAGTLNKRYGTTILFKNEKIKNCLLKISFSGTENLENVMAALSTIQGITYKIKQDTVIIDGQGCD